ncbi:unnamed protein product [Zymoseptoria tritici ST99CH_3D7]|uniref:Peptidase A1 domain-containing protein n=1 Tax=Zymoseptoria tritici (strain ST99CH_3D7) TaxID=1276538 RepID=A0A1X7RG01_ZYMT9|nr:unnamed protein product [Zymoseptoria tritici ST99CH_3D7]
MYTLFIFLAVCTVSFGNPGLRSRRTGTHRRNALSGDAAHPKRTIDHREAAACENGTYVADIVWMEQGTSPGLNVQVGEDVLTVVFDLGSSPFYVLGANWGCIDHIYGNITHYPRSKCGGEANTTSPGFTFSGGSIIGAGFNSTYAGGLYGALGEIGYQEITLGNLTVPNAITGIATQVEIARSGVLSTNGVMGFAFPFLTSYWRRSELDQVGELQYVTNISHYKPVVFQAAADGLVNPIFGYYYDGLGGVDGTVCGQLTLGAEPNIRSGPYSQDVPVVPYTDETGDPSTHNFAFWNFHIDGLKILHSPDADPVIFSYLDDDPVDVIPFEGNGTSMPPYIKHTPALDTGTLYSSIPRDVFDELTKHIDPAPFVDKYGVLATACNATVPDLAVMIAGSDLWFNRSGIVFPPSWNPEEESCELAITADDFVGLGSTWLINVVAVHDFSDSERPVSRFAQRVWE